MRELKHPDVRFVSLTEILAALADPLRLQIVTALAQRRGEIPWGELDVAVNKATLSHHIKTLRLAGIIAHRTEGTRCFVSLRREVNRVYPGLLKAILKANAGTRREARV